MAVQAATDRWTSVAPGWHRFRTDIERTETTVTDRLLAGLGELDGARVLELGAGTGELSARLADAVGPHGSVVSSDAADGMLELIRGRVGGLANIETAQLDACDIARPDGEFDAVVFRMGLMMAPEPDRALAQVRRVLRRGGRFATAVWGPPQDNPWLATVGMAAVMTGLVSCGPPVGPGEPFSLTDPGALSARAEAAGFVDVAATPIAFDRSYADLDTYVDMITSMAPPIAAAFAGASDAQRATLRDRVRELTGRFETDGALVIPAVAIVLSARVP